MEVITKRSCGLDIHKKIIVGTILVESQDGVITEQAREFGTTLKECTILAAWLSENKIELTVMESTGIYWKNIYAALEKEGLKTFVVNARQVKQVPGRKTDVKDSQWLARLARHGLLKKVRKLVRDATRSGICCANQQMQLQKLTVNLNKNINHL